MSDSKASKWQNISAGPRQVKDFNKAVSALRSEGQTHTELWGVIGGEEHQSALMSMFGPVRPEVVALDEAIRAKYDGKVTSGNVRSIIADYAAALPKARESRPVDDKRRTPEQDAELTAQAAARAAKEKAEQDERDAVLNAVMAKAPHGAKALIIAEYREDASDIQTDYFNSRTVRTVAIGWRFSSREDFRALRAAAAAFPETAHMADEGTLKAWQVERNGRAWGELEHRDNYSMGAGNYLSDHGGAHSGTGWVVKSAALPCRYVHLTEDATREPAQQWAAQHGQECQQAARDRDRAGATSADGTLTVQGSSLGKPGVIELRFASKPDEDVREALKRGAGFRWAKFSGCWYGSQDAYEAARAHWPALPELPANGTATEPAPALATA